MNINEFDPNGTGQDNGNYFGLPFTAEESDLVLISAPWDVTASYGGGACYGPDAIIGASTQLDLYDPIAPDQWRRGIATAPIDYTIQDRSNKYREEARKVMKYLEVGGKSSDETIEGRIEKVNAASEKLNQEVYNQTIEWLAKGKLVGLVGGDHSTPFGAIRAIAEYENGVGVLHIDAHADLRVAYEGFVYSHASIMYNVVSRIPQVERLVQVAVRDQCDAEVEFAENNPKITQIQDYQLAESAFKGVTWDEQCSRIIEQLPLKVYVSFDIDGLSPDNCPNTGTPVAGGLSFNQAVYLLAKVAESGRRIVGFDICEVAPHGDSEWDANVGARILYKLSNLTLKTNPNK